MPPGWILLTTWLLHFSTANALSDPAPTVRTFSRTAGESALRQVQWLGSRVAQKEDTFEQERQEAKVVGLGGAVLSNQKRQLVDAPVPEEMKEGTVKNQQETQVWEALVRLEQDMQMLDRVAGDKPQLSALEFGLLAGAVASAAGGPFFLGGHLSGVIAPSAAAFTAAIGISAEYTGKVAVADGKEVAAASIQCAAEAEGYLAQAERAKAVTPLCVGIGATAASLALLVPVFLDTAMKDVPLVTEIYLLCPLVGILAAAVASLAFQETQSFARQAIGIGNRRFARSGLVGRTWQSSTEQIMRKSQSSSTKWRNFALAVLPAPIIGALIPGGGLATKTIVTAALAAAQSAYYLTLAESVLARATDAVAIKARSAAVCDTYANQGARSAAILPFTSALCGLCAAATAALVELPFVESLALAGTLTGSLGQAITVATLPSLSALFAAAASVSKARCEVDAEAAVQAASTLAIPYEDEAEDPLLRPFNGVLELIRLTYRNNVLTRPWRRFLRIISVRRRFRMAKIWLKRRSQRGLEE